MGADTGRRSAALYLDFDNVFAALDEWAAWQFATEPARWAAWLAAGQDGACPPRRILVRRCYLNPMGWKNLEPGGALSSRLGHSRLHYGRFREKFVRAGFQVVDCPRLARLKNAADIVMALDIADALAHPTRFDEFILLSGDSDFTPLLHRLRAHDRRSLLVAHGTAAEALRSAADAAIALDDFAEAAVLAPETAGAVAADPPRPEPPPSPDAPRPAAVRPAPQRESTALAAALDPVPAPADSAAQRSAILDFVRRALAEADRPIHLGRLGQRVHAELGGWVKRGRFGKAGTLAKLIQETPGLAVEAGPGGGSLYDPERHDRPSLAQPDMVEGPLGPALATLRVALGPELPVPRLGPEELDFALRGLAASLPLSAAPDPEACAALAAEAAETGLDLPGGELEAVVLWLSRADLDWCAAPGETPTLRLASVLYGEVTRQAEAAGARLEPETLDALRDWIGLPRSGDGGGEASFTPPADRRAPP